MTSFTIPDPSVSVNLDAVMRAYVPPQQVRSEGAGALAVIKAAFQSENLIVSAFMDFHPTGPFDPTFDPYERADESRPPGPDNPFVHLDGYTDHLAAFADVRHPDDVKRVKDQIDRELENRRIIAQSGVGGFASVALAATLDPLIFVPFGGAAVKAARFGSVARKALKFGAIGGSIVTAQEAALHDSQRTRTIEESVRNVAGATVLTGLLGAAIGSMSLRKFRAAEAKTDRLLASEASAKPKTAVDLTEQQWEDVLLDKEIHPLDDLGVSKADQATLAAERADDPLAPGGITVDHANVDSLTTPRQFSIEAGTDSQVAGSLGFGRVAKWLSPRLQLFMSKSAIVSKAANFLVQSPVKLKGAAIAFNAEVEVRLARVKARNALQTVEHLYARYASDSARSQASVIQQSFGFRRVRGKLSIDEFHVEVVRAMRAGDTHAVPEVQAAAKLLRKEVIAPWRERAIKNGLLPESVRDHPGFLTRLWNTDKLRQVDAAGHLIERDLLVDELVQWDLEKHAAQGREAEFSAAASRRVAVSQVNRLTRIPDGRMMPGDAAFRTSLHERTIDIPDERIARWISNDLERIITYYARTMSSDIALIERFGLVRARAGMDETRASFVGRIRHAEEAKDALKILRSRDRAIVNTYGGRRLSKAMGAKRTSLVNRIRNADTDQVAADILKARDEDIINQFSTGNLKLLFDQVETDYKKAIRAASKTSRTEAERLKRRMRRDIRNLGLARDDIRGLLSIPADPTALGPRALLGARQLTYLAVGGSIMLSSVADMALSIYNYGFLRAFRTATTAFLGDMRSLKIGLEDIKMGLGPSEILTNARVARLFDIENEALPRTFFERGLNWATHRFSLANLISPWNAMMRGWGGLTAQSLITEMGVRAARGKTVPKWARLRLEELGFDQAMLVRVGEQFEKYGGVGGRRKFYAPNTGVWTDEGAVISMRAAMQKVYDHIIIKGSPLDRPVIPGVSTVPGLGPELSKTIFFFLNFGLAANTRILMRGLQYRDARVLSGLMAMVSFGMLSVYLKRKSAGREPPENLGKWVAQGVEQSGASGFVFDIDHLLSAASNGKFGLSATLGTGRRYYSPQEGIAAVFGPVAGQAMEALELAGGVSDLDPDPADVRRLRRLMIMQNHFLLRRLFDKVQDASEDTVR